MKGSSPMLFFLAQASKTWKCTSAVTKQTLPISNVAFTRHCHNAQCPRSAVGVMDQPKPNSSDDSAFERAQETSRITCAGFISLHIPIPFSSYSSKNTDPLLSKLVLSRSPFSRLGNYQELLPG